MVYLEFAGEELENMLIEGFTEEFCIRLLSQGLEHIKYIPEEKWTDKVFDRCAQTYFEHPSSNMTMLEYIPEIYVSSDVWINFIKAYPETMLYVPKKYHTKEMFLELVKCGGMNLQYIPSNRQSGEICKVAINNDARALQFVMKRFITDDLVRSAMEADPSVFPFVPDEYKDNVFSLIPDEYKAMALLWLTDECKPTAMMLVPAEYKTIDIYLAYYKALVRSLAGRYGRVSRHTPGAREVMSGAPTHINDDVDITRMQRELGLRYCVSKMYDSETSTFRTVDVVGYRKDLYGVFRAVHETIEYDNFQHFYEHLDGDISGVDLYAYDFEGVDFEGIDLEGALIKSDILDKLGVYDNTFYESIAVEDIEQTCEDDIGYVSTVKQIETSTSLIPKSSHPKLNEHINTNNFYYISDVHLDHMIKRRFPKRASYLEIKYYVRELIRDMTPGENSSIPIIIMGDVSSSVELFNLFYEELANICNQNKIVAVLGNHELWGNGLGGLTHQELIAHYRTKFGSLGITLLENDVLFYHPDGTYHILDLNYMGSLTDEELSQIGVDYKYMILGGVGYSGYNPEFNASHGLYRNTIPTIEKDIELTKQFNNMYERLNRTMAERKMIVATHMPKHDWSNTTHNPNWVYLHGHTHHNAMVNNADMTVYADNQIGYHADNPRLKSFMIDTLYDIFEFYDDGVYTITRSEYLEFNRYKGISVEMNAVEGTVTMLKKKGLYLFLYESPKNGRLNLLYGGSRRRLENQDISYYYDNMVEYANKVEYHMREYYKALKEISNLVRSMGGSGHIHGCIIDIDFYNHIYLNPHDGSVVPYYATSTTDKYVYSDIESLLHTHLPEMADKYLEMVEESDLLPDISSTLTSEYEKGGLLAYVSSTEMYKPSRRILGLQYITNYDVIRVWYDNILDYESPETFQIESDTWRPNK